MNISCVFIDDFRSDLRDDEVYTYIYTSFKIDISKRKEEKRKCNVSNDCPDKKHHTANFTFVGQFSEHGYPYLCQIVTRDTGVTSQSKL